MSARIESATCEARADVRRGPAGICAFTVAPAIAAQQVIISQMRVIVFSGEGRAASEDLLRGEPCRCFGGPPSGSNSGFDDEEALVRKCVARHRSDDRH